MKGKLIILGLSFLLMAGSAAAASRQDQAGPQPVDRKAIVQEILGLWENAPNPVNAQNEAQYGDLRAALKTATMEQLLDARRARTFDDVWAAMPKGGRRALAAGRVPLALGDVGDDLVYTPVTPCRIIDTRGGIAPYTGVIGPNKGNWFYVTGSTYANQGGFAGSCGIPSSPKPAAVAINITSTGQAGSGNLRAIQTGGGTPNVSLVNYVVGVNIANAAIVTSYPGAGEEIYIYSANSTSHAVVDIMGYYSGPQAAQELFAENAPGALNFSNALFLCKTTTFTPTQAWTAYPYGVVSVLPDSTGALGWTADAYYTADGGASWTYMGNGWIMRGGAPASTWGSSVTNAVSRLNLTSGTTYQFAINVSRATGTGNATDSRCSLHVRFE
jgi:hypothetical protein